MKTIMKAARCIGAASRSACSRARKACCNARASAHNNAAVTSAASGRPSSTANCNGRLWVWSKNATGRPGNGVNVQAKLNSPKPTPAHGCMRIKLSVLAQMP